MERPRKLLNIDPNGKIYFVGIGGYSMNGLARICKNFGFNVFGSDLEKSERTVHLEDIGIEVFYSHTPVNIDIAKPDCLVYSAAVQKNNPELLRAKELKIPVYERSFFLGALNGFYDKVINIAGTHGKTTTTTICSLILEKSNIDHTAHIGAVVDDWESTVRISSSKKLLVSEACEYNSSFLRFRSTTAAILNIDHDHVDCFPEIEDVIEVFAQFADTIPPEGYLVIPASDPNVERMLERLKAIKIDRHGSIESYMPHLISFGREKDTFQGKPPFFSMKNYHLTDGYPSFDVYREDEKLCHIDLAMPGEYNALNSLAAVACAQLNGGKAFACKEVLAKFKGADNRFSYVGKYNGLDIFSDYAHHPLSISLSLNAAKSISKGGVIPVFQPITFSRAESLFTEFVKSLESWPNSLIMEVYTSRAGESQNSPFSSASICKEINRKGGKSHFIKDYESLKAAIDKFACPGDTIFFMGPEVLKKHAKRLVDEQKINGEH